MGNNMTEEVRPQPPTQTTTQSTPQVTTPQVATQPPRQELTPEQREFMNILNDLIMSAQELSYALAVVDSSKASQDEGIKELIETARNVVRNVWRFHRFVKQRMRVGPR